ncbi:MAG: threonine--tRNA ligase [Patescibacteria group bacterium]
MNKNLETMRHSASHVLAAAVLKLYPGTKLGIGPAIEDGFYYDFDFEKPITEKDLEKIVDAMVHIAVSRVPFKKRMISISEARKLFKNQPYKLELINELEKEDSKQVSLYETGDFLDLCAGPHVSNTGKIGPLKLLSLAGAYWRGEEKNKMLTRIYGTCFETQKELDQYLWQLEEAKKRDHRKLGKELGLFIIPDEVGPGLLIWTPRGAIIRREIEKFIVDEQAKRGYQHVYSPHIGRKSLWVTSGHWDLYQDKMYSPMKIDKEDYLIKPMNCPMHMMIYKSELRSYRDLPLRIAENATVYRYEQTGELSGMIRVRYITQDDSHIFCREDQVVEEFIGVIDYTMFLLKAFRIGDFYLRFSVRDPKNKDKYLGDDKTWEEAEIKIEEALKKAGLTPKKAEGEAAFYGPKLDVMIKDVLGREWQCGTIQVDFMLPERFKLEYIDKDGKTKRPVLIHRAPLGSLERWVGLLIEHYAGAFPIWLAPVQVVVIPITDKQIKYGQEIADKLKEAGERVELDNRNETTSAKIRDAELQKVPYMVIVGEKEVKAKNISVRARGEKDLGKMMLEKFLGKITLEIEKKI